MAARDIKGQSWNTLQVQTDLACSFLAASQQCTTLPPEYYRWKKSVGCAIHGARSSAEWRLHCSRTSPAAALGRMCQGIPMDPQRHPCSLPQGWESHGSIAMEHFLQITAFSSPKGLMDHLYLNHLRVSKRLEIFLLNFQWAHSLIFSSQPFPSLVSLLCIRNTSYTGNHLPAVPGCILPNWETQMAIPLILLANWGWIGTGLGSNSRENCILFPTISEKMSSKVSTSNEKGGKKGRGIEQTST